jgi:hypothetical protein
VSLDLDLIQAIDARVAVAMARWTTWGTVASRTDLQNAMVTFDGATMAIPCKVLGDCDILEGDRVALLLIGPWWTVIGAMARHWPTDFGATVDQTTPGNTASSSFVDLPTTTSFTFTKRWDATQVEVYMAARAYISGTLGGVEFGAGFSSPRYAAQTFAVASSKFSNVGDYDTCTETVWLPSIPADTYTVSAQWRRYTGTGSLNVDGDCSVTITAKEVGP